MTAIPTLRVAHPQNPEQFVTVNATDYRPLVHGPLWPEQLPDFAGVPAPQPTHYTPAERDLAGSLLLEMMEYTELQKGREFSALPPAERMVRLRDYRNEFQEAREKHVRVTEARRADTEAAAREKQDNEQTPTATKAPAPAQATEAAAQPLPAPATTPAPPPAGAEPAPASDKPAWLQPKSPAPVAATVEKGPGAKYYVMLGKDVKSEGFPKKADADAKLKVLFPEA